MNILNMQGMSTRQVLNPLGGIALTNQHEKLQEDIATLLITRRGSIIGNPSYGSYLHEILFETGNESTLARVKAEISRILTSNYNFIDTVEIECTMEGNLLHAEISYTTINVNLSTKLEFDIPLSSEGGIAYE